MLQNIGVDWRDRNLIAKLYLGQKAVIKINNELSGCCEIGQGVYDKVVHYLRYCLTSTGCGLKNDPTPKM